MLEQTDPCDGEPGSINDRPSIKPQVWYNTKSVEQNIEVLTKYSKNPWAKQIVRNGTYQVDQRRQIIS